jgi:hypothetical protein
MRALQGRLLHSPLGRSVLRTVNPVLMDNEVIPAHDIQAAIDADLAATHLLMLAGASTASLSELMGIESVCQRVLSNCDRRVYHTRIQRNIIARHFNGVPDDLMAITLVRYFRDELSRSNNAQLTLNEALSRIDRLQSVINRSSLRTTPSPLPVQCETMGMLDWFITIDGQQLSMADLGNIRGALGSVSHIFGAGCQQVASHSHVVVRLASTMTADLIRTCLQRLGYTCSVQPVRESVEACRVYIESQRVTPMYSLHMRNTGPGGSSTSPRDNPAQRLFLDGHTHTEQEWKSAVTQSIDAGVPWDALKYMTRFFPRKVRRTFKKQSARVASGLTRDWDYQVTFATEGQLPLHLAEAFSGYGHGCVFDAGKGLANWAGECVLLCNNTSQYDAVRAFLAGGHRRVVRVLVAT